MNERIDLSRGLHGKLKMRHWLVHQASSKIYHGLRWMDEEKTMLRIPWKHGSNGGWNAEDGKLFEDWAFYSGKFDSTRPKNSRKFKANFRCALRSLSDVIEVKERSRKTGKDACKVFKFLEEKRKRPVNYHKNGISFSGSERSNEPTSEDYTSHRHSSSSSSSSTSFTNTTFTNCCNNQFIFNNYIASPNISQSTPSNASSSILLKMRRQSTVGATNYLQGSGRLEFSTGNGTQYSTILAPPTSAIDFDRHHHHYYHNHYFNSASGYVGGNGGSHVIAENDWRDISEFLKEEAEQMTYNKNYFNLQ